jgi:hypothetical protein
VHGEQLDAAAHTQARPFHPAGRPGGRVVGAAAGAVDLYPQVNVRPLAGAKSPPTTTSSAAGAYAPPLEQGAPNAPRRGLRCPLAPGNARRPTRRRPRHAARVRRAWALRVRAVQFSREGPRRLPASTGCSPAGRLRSGCRPCRPRSAASTTDLRPERASRWCRMSGGPQRAGGSPGVPVDTRLRALPSSVAVGKSGSLGRVRRALERVARGGRAAWSQVRPRRRLSCGCGA